MNHLLTGLFGLAAAVIPLHAQFNPFDDAGGGGTTSEKRLIAEVSAIAPGEPFLVGLHLDHPDGWHSYYENSGGIEKSPEIQWTLPEGYSAGAIQWPVPEVKEAYGNMSYVYNGSVTFLVEITPPADAEIGSTATLSAEAAWQICETSCIDESGSFTLQLPVAETPSADASNADIFTTALAALPVEAPGLEISSSSTDTSVTLEISGEDLEEPVEFIPNQPYLKPLSEGGSVDFSDGKLTLVIPRKLVDFLDDEIEQGEEISGILKFESRPALAISPQNAAIESGSPVAIAPKGMFQLLGIFGGMMLGGMILNLMPCVFPVIGLKIMNFVQQSGQDRRKIAMHGLAFTGGVVASFAVLSGILFAVREAASASGGDAAGWGFQLQYPWVTLVLMLLMFVLGLNMYGVFEIGAKATSVGGNLQNKQGVSGSFFSGVLATVVATPCSAPFLGVAIGAAMVLPPIPFFLAFGAMAIGLSLPYLILSLFPRFVELLPRPGSWMESFKQGMSFLLFATAGYLLFVYTGQVGVDNMFDVILGLSAIAVAAWVYGRWSLPHRTQRIRHIAMALAAVFAIGGVWSASPPQPKENPLVWENWSQARVDELLAMGTPVYVDFTATWCVTCQVNKKRAYSQEVVDLIHERGIVTLKGDKTMPNPAVDEAIRGLKRGAIPVNVLYRPGQEPIVTPELLSPTYLLDLFNFAGPLPNGEKRY